MSAGAAPQRKANAIADHITPEEFADAYVKAIRSAVYEQEIVPGVAAARAMLRQFAVARRADGSQPAPGELAAYYDAARHAACMDGVAHPHTQAAETVLEEFTIARPHPGTAT